ncbi:transcriptional regulator [Leptolyngbya sp. NIES-3755]|nr:transcriptional regulator [Leptolyngbya sp. NIES-3755]
MLWVTLDRTSDVPLIRQIYLQLRDRILNGQLSAGERLPASREWAAHLGVSRNVIVEAYDQLIAEGYLETRPGAGTYIAQGATWKIGTVQPILSIEPTPSEDWIDFRSGIPALEYFPQKLWGQLTRQACTTLSEHTLSYSSAEGLAELRQVLAQYLWRSRGVQCHPDQIIVTTGATQAFNLIAKLLVKPGCMIAIEDPTAPELRSIYSACSNLYSVPVDKHGLQTDLLPRDRFLCFIHITPSHQFPLGSVLTIQRRIALLEYAQATDSFVLEDDYDSEFRYEGTPVSSLQGLAPDRVIYVGTFSKILAPGLRLGYLILPPALIDRGRELKRFSDLHTTTIDQLTLACFIADGHLERHILRMKKLYRQRRNFLRQYMIECFGNNVQILGDSTGLHLVAEFASVQFTPKVIQQLNQQRVRVYPISNYASSARLHQIMLGYGNLSIDTIQQGVDRLNIALNQAR